MARLEYNEYGVLEWIAPIPNITAGAPAWTQYHARVRDDTTALNTSGGWLGNLDSNPTNPISSGSANKFRIRFLLDEFNDKVAGVTPTLYYNRNNTGWNPVTTTDSYVRPISSGQYTDGDSCSTQLLTGSDPASGAFENVGYADSADGATATSTIATKNDFFECEFCIYFESGVVNNDTIQFRVQNGATALDSYTYAGPTVTVSVSGLDLVKIRDEACGPDETVVKTKSIFKIRDEDLDIDDSGLVKVMDLIHLVAEACGPDEVSVVVRSLIRILDESLNVDEVGIFVKTILQIVSEVFDIDETSVKVRGVVQVVSEVFDFIESVLIRRKFSGYVKRIVARSY